MEPRSAGKLGHTQNVNVSCIKKTDSAMTLSQALDRSMLKDVAVPVLNSSHLGTEDDLVPVDFEAYDAQELESGLIEQANRAFEQTLYEGQQLHVKRGNMQEASTSSRQQAEVDVRSETSSPRNFVRVKRLRTQSSSSDSYIPSSNESDDAKIEVSAEDADGNACQPSASKAASRKRKREKKRRERLVGDDGNEQHFMERRRRAELLEANRGSEVHHINDDHFVSKHAWGQLYKYQKAGVRWLHQLHCQYVGGILADEMGLGKTVQICVFLRSIAQSQQPSRIFKYKGLGPVLIVCPATIMHQWVRELNTWFPLCRVAVLHASGAHTGPKHSLLSKMTAWRKDGSVLITSYSTYTQERASFLAFDWYYAILDEGHKIRNPDAMVTMSLKELKTPHRLILTGSPMQNNLRELWSLNDFIFPGHLGSLKLFTERFSIPITQGGYANASPLQVRTAYKCHNNKEQHKRAFRDAISPYMLRRTKKEVEMAIQLPEKTEQILFCDLTETQRQLYLEFLNSKMCGNILSGRIDAFAGLITLRKLWSNHPDLVNGGPNRHGEYDVAQLPEMDFGAAVRSGKMLVLKSLLRMWRKQQQKVLLFSQSRQMLTIMEKFVILEGYNYLRLDGETPIGIRQGLVEKFNSDGEIFIFLLTTRVGGLGVNLTGANRVVIYDPDWNPSTDVQARERAWRIGQRRPVTVYRLLTSGTIEEKIYQRQIFKHFLVNKVLAEPRQQRFFKTNDLHELFTLHSGKTTEKGHGTETAAIFASTAEEMRRGNHFDQQEKGKKARSGRQNPGAHEGDAVEDEDEGGEMELSEDRKKELMEQAKRIAKSLVEYEKTGDCSATAAPKRKRLFEGRRHIPYLRKKKVMKHRGECRAKAKEELRDSRQQDDYVLKKLLRGKAGVNSALRHDQIIDGSSAADLQLIEDEAELVAKRAAQVLKKTLRAPLHGSNRPPLGLFGTRAETWNSGALSSSSLLKSIRERKERMLETREDDGSHASSNEDYPSLTSTPGGADVLPMGDRFESIANGLRAFFTGRAGRATTDEVLSRFNEDISPADSFAFRSILKRLARLQPNTSQWVLKEEYR